MLPSWTICGRLSIRKRGRSGVSRPASIRHRARPRSPRIRAPLHVQGHPSHTMAMPGIAMSPEPREEAVAAAFRLRFDMKKEPDVTQPAGYGFGMRYLLVLAAALALPAQARIGETHAETVKRFGQPSDTKRCDDGSVVCATFQKNQIS